MGSMSGGKAALASTATEEKRQLTIVIPTSFPPTIHNTAGGEDKGTNRSTEGFTTGPSTGIPKEIKPRETPKRIPEGTT